MVEDCAPDEPQRGADGAKGSDPRQVGVIVKSLASLSKDFKYVDRVIAKHYNKMVRYNE